MWRKLAVAVAGSSLSSVPSPTDSFSPGLGPMAFTSTSSKSLKSLPKPELVERVMSYANVAELDETCFCTSETVLADGTQTLDFPNSEILGGIFELNCCCRLKSLIKFSMWLRPQEASYWNLHFRAQKCGAECRKSFMWWPSVIAKTYGLDRPFRL